MGDGVIGSMITLLNESNNNTSYRSGISSLQLNSLRKLDNCQLSVTKVHGHNPQVLRNTLWTNQGWGWNTDQPHLKPTFSESMVLDTWSHASLEQCSAIANAFMCFHITQFGIEISLTMQARYEHESSPINVFNQPLNSVFDSHSFLYFWVYSLDRDMSQLNV